MKLGAAVIAAAALTAALAPTAHAEARRTAQLRLLCVQLSGDLTEPGGMAAFQRCLRSHDPVAAIRRNAAPPRNRRLAAALAPHPVALTRGTTALVGQSDVCRPGLVWRESTPTDHVCVTPAVRARFRR